MLSACSRQSCCDFYLTDIYIYSRLFLNRQTDTALQNVCQLCAPIKKYCDLRVLFRLHGYHPIRSGGAECRLLVRAVLARLDDQRELARERRLRDGRRLVLAAERATVHVEDYNGGKRHASHS